MELKILAKGAKREDIVKFLQESFARYDREDALAILEISMAANENIYRELKEDSKMVGAFERFNACLMTAIFSSISQMFFATSV